MYQEEKSFTLRFSLEVTFPDSYEGDADNKAWVNEWENLIKPQVIKQVFETLREHRAWSSHIRNRGLSPADEIEIVLERDFSKPAPFTLMP